MKSDERQILYFDLKLTGGTRARGIDGPLPSPRTLNQFCEDLIFLRESGLAYSYRESSPMAFTLEDMEEHEDCWVLLLNLVDTRAAHPVTNQIRGSEADRQVITLTGGRGLESSSHLVIYKAADEAGKHLLLCERNESFPFFTIRKFLNKLAAEAAKVRQEDYSGVHPDGSGRSIKRYCLITLLGHPSNQFQEDLIAGKLSELSLTTGLERIVGYEANDFPEFKSTEIKMDVKGFSVQESGGNLSHFQKAIQYGRALDAALIRVKFLDPEGSSRTADIDPHTGTLVNTEHYVKKGRISEFGAALRTAYPTIHTEISDRMRALED